MNTIEYHLLNDFQRNLPLCASPFAQLGETLDMDEASTIAALIRLKAEGKISRVGAVFRPNTVSVSTLAALIVPEQRLDAVAELVTACPAISHNYEREYRWNLWFVAAERDETRLTTLLDDIERRTACPMLRLPLVESYHIDLGFDLDAASRGKPDERPLALARHDTTRTRLNEGDALLADQLRSGLALVPRPYAELAARAGTSEETVINKVAQWISDGVITRFGVIVRHHELGFTSNAMVAFDIPDDLTTDIGLRIATTPEVSLCACRERSLPEWPFNVYCMIHGKDEQRVLRQIERLRERCGLLNCPFAVLFSRRRFKQQAARIPVEVAHG